MSAELTVNFRARRVATILFYAAAALTVAHCLSVIAWYEDLLPIDDWLYYSFFDLDEEESIGTWFSALILFGAGQLSWLLARIQRPSPNGKYAWWLLLAIGFHLLSLDEVAGFHEFINTIVEDTHWTTFGAGIALLIAIAYLPFLWSLPTSTRYLLMASGAIYLGGAVGVEWATIWYEDNDQLDTLPYNLWNGLEEFMEMFGIVLYIYTLLDYIERTKPGYTLTFKFQNNP